jgi:hypothetical protein
MNTQLHLLRGRGNLLLEKAILDSRPIWRSETTKNIAKLLGVPLQNLANWRVRDQGPISFKAPKGRGNKILYNVNDVLSWLTQYRPWEINRMWLLERGLVPPDATEDHTTWAKSAIFGPN